MAWFSTSRMSWPRFLRFSLFSHHESKIHAGYIHESCDDFHFLAKIFYPKDYSVLSACISFATSSVRKQENKLFVRKKKGTIGISLDSVSTTPFSLS